MIDQLIAQIERRRNPVCAGLDTLLEYVPPMLRPNRGSKSDLEYAASCLYAYNCALIDAVADVVPCVKIQSACYEMYGPPGVEVFNRTIDYARQNGLVTIADVKRNDIGSTASDYAAAYIGRTDVSGRQVPVFDADFMTVNAYLGSDGIDPFVESCRQFNKGIFVLVRTSNPSAGELQDLRLEDGQTVYERMMDHVATWGAGLEGQDGFSQVGAVVGATRPEQAVALRKRAPGIFFLLPGVGAQGGDAGRLAGCFNSRGRGAIINNSRQMLTAWQKEKDPERADAPAAARSVLLDLQQRILLSFEAQGISYREDA